MQQKELEIMKEVKGHGKMRWPKMYLIGIWDGNIWRNIGWEFSIIDEKHIS